MKKIDNNEGRHFPAVYCIFFRVRLFHMKWKYWSPIHHGNILRKNWQGILICFSFLKVMNCVCVVVINFKPIVFNNACFYCKIDG